MRTHDENVEYELCCTDNLSAPSATEDLTRVCHAVHMRVSELELAEYVAGVSCQNAYSDYQYASAKMPWLVIPLNIVGGVT